MNKKSEYIKSPSVFILNRNCNYYYCYDFYVLISSSSPRRIINNLFIILVNICHVYKYFYSTIIYNSITCLGFSSVCARFFFFLCYLRVMINSHNFSFVGKEQKEKVFFYFLYQFYVFLRYVFVLCSTYEMDPAIRYCGDCHCCYTYSHICSSTKT